MKRLQIMIDEDLDDALEHTARAEGTSKAALVRRYVAAQLRPVPRIEDDPIWELVGLVTGAESADVDDVVYPR